MFVCNICEDLYSALPACSQPLCVSCMPLPVACAVEVMLKRVIQMSRLWPISLFVLAATFSLPLCQDYTVCWVLPPVSLGRVTLRHLSQAGTACGACQVLKQATESRVQGTKQAFSCSAPSFWSVHKNRACLSLSINI